MVNKIRNKITQVLGFCNLCAIFAVGLKTTYINVYIIKEQCSSTIFQR